jgi:hypothetical protein
MQHTCSVCHRVTCTYPAESAFTNPLRVLVPDTFADLFPPIPSPLPLFTPSQPPASLSPPSPPPMSPPQLVPPAHSWRASRPLPPSRTRLWWRWVTPWAAPTAWPT